MAKKKKIEKEDLKDIFKESSMTVLKNANDLQSEVDSYPENSEPIQKEDVITNANIDIPMSNNTPEKKRNWDNLKEAFDNDMTDRFMGIMDKLPDREYIRVYVKVADFFKPKMTRTQNVEAPKDNKLEIVINSSKNKLKVS